MNYLVVSQDLRWVYITTWDYFAELSGLVTCKHSTVLVDFIGYMFLPLLPSVILRILRNYLNGLTSCKYMYYVTFNSYWYDCIDMRIIIYRAKWYLTLSYAYYSSVVHNNIKSHKKRGGSLWVNTYTQHAGNIIPHQENKYIFKHGIGKMTKDDDVGG